tara:strand:- start:5947 stop:7083 length:1137 start_codon:yes stop_codon:yes gene_type:complete
VIYYFSFFLLNVLFGLTNYIEKLKKFSKFFEIFAILLFIFIAGFRYEVGGDWDNYIIQFDGFSTIGFPSVAIFTSSDPVYIILNVISYKLGFGFVGVNVMCSAIFFLSFYLYIKKYENTIIGLVSTFLFIFVILSLGFTRQCLAIGFIFLFLNACYIRNFLFQFIFVILALASHKSSLIFFLFYIISVILNELPFLYNNKKKLFLRFKYQIIISIIFILVLFMIFLIRDLERLLGVYLSLNREIHIDVHQSRTSPGVIYKFTFILFFSFLYLIFRKNMNFINKYERYIFDTYLIFSLSLLPLVGYLSLFVDRAIIYCYPFVALIICKYVQTKVKEKFKLIFFLICSLISLLILYIWMEFANHSQYWIPYKNYLFLNKF